MQGWSDFDECDLFECQIPRHHFVSLGMTPARPVGPEEILHREELLKESFGFLVALLIENNRPGPGFGV